MTTNTKTEARITVLMAALNEHEQAKQTKDPEANPYANKDLDFITANPGFPALNMAAKAPDSPLAYDLEVARNEARREAVAKGEGKKKMQQRARVARKAEIDKIADAPARPPQARLDQAWLVVFHMVATITKMAKGKQRWAGRMLGDVMDDVAQLTLENMALLLAKQTQFDLKVLREAAEQIGARDRGERVKVKENDDPKHAKSLRKARKWLMQVANNRVQATLIDTYMRSPNLRWENIDMIGTVMTHINGPGEDPMLENFKANRAPAFQGTRFQRPDGLDPNLLAMAITAAITERGLDPLVEFILDDEHRRTDGAVMWSEHAKDIFMLTPGGQGPWMWKAVKQATEKHNHQRKARGDAARTHVRNLFEFLPSVITSLVDSFDPHFIGWSTTGHRAVMASDFELFYCPDKPGDELQERRLIFEPALRYGSTEEAARALVEHLAALTTGEQVVDSVVNA